MLNADWSDKVVYELENFSPENEKRFKNDILDATADCFNWIVNRKTQKITTTFSPASLTKANEFSKI